MATPPGGQDGTAIDLACLGASDLRDVQCLQEGHASDGRLPILFDEIVLEAADLAGLEHLDPVDGVLAARQGAGAPTTPTGSRATTGSCAGTTRSARGSRCAPRGRPRACRATGSTCACRTRRFLRREL